MARTADINPSVLHENIVDVLYHAKPEHWRDGMNWYNHASREIARLGAKHNMPYETTAAIVAVLSPQLRWSRNILAADVIMGGKVPSAVLGTSVRKAIRLMSGESIESVLGGDKVNAFFRNLTLNFEHVTVDVHAVDAACRDDYTFNRSTIKDSRYNAIADAYKAVARSLSLPPAVVQAVAWVTWRDLFYSKSRNLKVGYA
jgi:hypothetical protein